jgi:hypothetical protein
MVEMLKKLTLALGFTTFLVSPAMADLIFRGAVDLQGTGLGAVDTILTMTSHANGTSESGMVSWNGTTNVVTPDPNPPGYTPPGTTDMTGINQTITIATTGYTSGDNLGIMFNPVEPGPIGGTPNSITLNNLVLTIYDGATGATEFTAPWLGGPLTLQAIDQGTGNSGYLFSLNQAEIDELTQAAVTGTDRIGLLAYATNATGGHETFFATVLALDGQCPNPPCVVTPQCTIENPCPAPEPVSIVVLGTGLAMVGGAYGWRRRLRAKTMRAGTAKA